MKDRRERGLCYNCNEKFSLGHRCKQLFVIEGIWPEEEESLENGVGEETVEEVPEISIHAISDTHAPQTMRILGKIGKQPLQVLVDSGSTHNFLNLQVAKRAGLTASAQGVFEVAVANGEKLRSAGRCRGVCLALHGEPICVDLYLLPLVGCDAVLGAQWLSTLGPILWDFSKLSMKFSNGGKEVLLQGEASAEAQIVGEEEMGRELRKQKEGAILQIFSLEGKLPSSNQCLDSQLAKLMLSFSDVFSEPKSLPPNRTHNHQIPLLPGNGPISVRPYHYPHFQKTQN